MIREELFRLQKQCLEYDWLSKSIDELKKYQQDLLKVIDGFNEIDEPVDKDLLNDLKDVIDLISILEKNNLTRLPQVNDVLLTKDGRAIGNCIVQAINLGVRLITLKTDYGNEVTIPLYLLPKYFHEQYKQAQNTHKHFTLTQPKPTKKYRVRLEFKVTTSEFIDVTVSATGIEEAKQLAIKKHKEDPQWIDMYAGDVIETTLDTEFIKDWEVEELTKDEN